MTQNLRGLWAAAGAAGGGGPGDALWSWGRNQNGQLGLGDIVDRSSPVQVGTGGYYQFIAGSGVSWMLRGDNTISAMGAKYTGDGTGLKQSSPVQIGSDTWSRIGGDRYTLHAVNSAGQLWGWGYNTFGEVGDGTNIGSSSPIQIGADTDWGTAINELSQGGNHAAFVKANGSLWMTGRSNRGQSGLGDLLTRSSPVQMGGTTWRQVAGGAEFSAATKTDGTLWTWGEANVGQLGNNTFTPNVSSPVQIGTLSDWDYCSAYGGFAVALKTDGTLWVWGLNSSGQLGLGDELNRSSPTQLGVATNWTAISGGLNHAGAINSAGELWMWGVGTNGRLGQDTDVLNHSSPVQVAGTDFLKVNCGGSHTLVTRTRA